MKREYDFSGAERGKFYRADAKLNLPRCPEPPDWAGPDNHLCDFITRETENTLRAYKEQPILVTEHARHEHDTAHGGYAHRQLFELVQNSADALAKVSDGRGILVRLTIDFLYCADDGKAIDEPGIEALMFSHMSPKRDTSEIGRFGLGFKSVLGVTEAPEIYSRSGSFRFDKKHAAERISRVAQAEHYPVLRLPIPVDAREVSEEDEDLRELMTWATNIVRLPLRPGATEDIAKQVQDFPPEFLLFVDHVRCLSLEHGERSRDFVLQRANDMLRLDADDGSSRWKCFKTEHRLSTRALEDRRSLDDSRSVPICWAAPLDQLNDHGYYWHFFPTKTASLLAGILNAPWKTNEDRQNLLPGPYNDELIDAAASMIAKHLPQLATEKDPALHLDALPRRHEDRDTEHSDRLRKRLDEKLQNSHIVPDQSGHLRTVTDIFYAPRELTQEQRVEEPLKKWEDFDLRPMDWLHHSALTRDRLAKINRLFPGLNQAPRSSIQDWLEALVEGRVGAEAITASRTAVKVAAAIPAEKRRHTELGEILLTQGSVWCAPDPDSVFLPFLDDQHENGHQLVHGELASDTETYDALKVLGIQHITPRTHFQSLAKKSLAQYSREPDEKLWIGFWQASREVEPDDAYLIIKALIDKEQAYWNPSIRTRSGRWRAIYSILLPGDIVPSEGDRDREVTVDIEFHRPDLELLKRLGATATPVPRQDLSHETFFRSYLSRCRRNFVRRDLPRNPQEHHLEFDSVIGSGPLNVLTLLSDEGKARYTDALLALDATYDRWTMRHDTQEIYPELSCQSPAIALLTRHGRIRCAGEFVPLTDALGNPPANPVALRLLLSHPMADRIRETFDLAEPSVEPLGEEDPVPLTDVWPGLAPHLPAQSHMWSLIRCEQFTGIDGINGVECVRVDSNVYLVSTGNENHDLQLVLHELGLDLSDDDIDKIREYVSPHDIAVRRAAVREHETDAEKLLHAVGNHALRSRLPESLLAVLESGRVPLTGVELAEAAIATYHTAALMEYRWALDPLAPPKRWAGSQPAVDFVQSLGFPPEWAGQRSSRRPPYLEVDGPYSLPELHNYQKRIVTRVKEMLCNGHAPSSDRRGMISLPTGSGKTRVAVQAIVEAICDGFSGGVLWVADRDELCEQAVEAWRQVWSSVGPEGNRLRVSRMWAGQPRPLPTGDLHVVVATIQTLNAKLSNQPEEYRFLADFELVVFDEAHRSIAPTFTTVMQEIGLTRWQRETEPFLLGLTATPYRGHDKEETARLVRRYGGNRLDAGAFASDEPEEVIGELQAMRVLAHADHEIIDGGDFSLNQDELNTLNAMPHPAWLPASMESRIAGDANRTRRIVESYENLVGDSRGEKWPTLIFATSVEHAMTVAALLNSQGIRSRAVSGSTETSVRRDIVEGFRAGEIDVLVNYGVFREGFDAPRTRVIIVARPVYSPNLYFQMIGRGLRGLKNGGNERCLIINVQDNIFNYSKALAFSELDWLWDNQPPHS